MKPIRTILLTAFLSLTVCLAIVYTACKKDHCNSVVCMNGGACNGGSCTCPVGYEGSTCETLSRNKFIFTFNGGDTCSSSNDTAYTRYPIYFLAIPSNPVEFTMKNILNNVNDSAICTMRSVDSFSFIGSNNGTTYIGSGTLHNDTLKLYYQVQQSTFSYSCGYIGGIYL